MKVGIDLGTTYSAVARYDRNSNKPIMIPNAFGKEITPSVICFLDDGDILVGEDAKDMQSNGTGVNAAAFKRNMGDGSIAVSFNGKDYTSEDLSAMLLKHLIADAEKATGEKIEDRHHPRRRVLRGEGAQDYQRAHGGGHLLRIQALH